MKPRWGRVDHISELGMLWDKNPDQEHLWETVPALAEVLEYCSKVRKNYDRLRAERESREKGGDSQER